MTDARSQTWVLARDDELLYGRDYARKTWGSVLVPDDDTADSSLSDRVFQLERDMEQLREAIGKSEHGDLGLNPQWKYEY